VNQFTYVTKNNVSITSLLTSLFQTKSAIANQKKISSHVASAEYRGKIVCSAANREGQHAETRLLRKKTMQTYRNKEIKVYVTRLSTNGHSMSRPCASCSRYIKKFWPLAKVFFTDADGFWFRDKLLDNDHQCMADRFSRICPSQISSSST